MTNRACRGAVISALFLVATACTDAVAPVPSTKAPARAAVMTPTEATLDSTSTSTTAPVCTATGAHGAHAFAGCSACHACAGGYELSPFTFPSGTAVEAGTISRTTEGTTCTTACHAPLGAEPQPVSWNAGPLRCTSCHTNIATTGAEPVRSSHVATATISHDTCTTCHDQSQHTSGTVRLIGGDGTTISTSCAGCHAGQGQTLGAATPPLLVGWTETASGDFHGAREGTCRFDHLDATGVRTGGEGGLACPADAPQPPMALLLTPYWWYDASGKWVWTCDVEPIDGSGNVVGAVLTGQPCPTGTALHNTSCGNPSYPQNCYPTTIVQRGFGGTLRAPYVRGQGPLPCSACHDFHQSTNAFLFARTVNGVAISASTIDRAGVGAQVLCNACHEGDRHDLCKDCHREYRVSDGEWSWFEGAPVDPVPDGSACFYCHGHEGLRQMRVVSPKYPGGHPYHTVGGKDQDACSHCHSAWAPPPTEYVAPAFTWDGAPAVSSVTGTSAVVTWRTNEPATSYVEYGVGTAGFVAGDDVLVRDHRVTLTGLAPSTTYVWRVRTSDVFRNFTQSALVSFTTPGALDVPSPDIAPVTLNVTWGTHQATAELLWYPVTAPSGQTVVYELQLASDEAFTWLENGSLSTTDPMWSGGVTGTETTISGQPGLSFPAAITNIPQDDCTGYFPNVYYWRVRATDGSTTSAWSATGSFDAFAYDSWCYW